MNSPISRASGVTETEHLLSTLCDKTFLKLWTYPNPYKSDGHEMCDLLVVFEDHVFIFFDRHNKSLEDADTLNIEKKWRRWKKASIDKQMRTARGAERYLKNPENKLYLDGKKSSLFPIKFDRDKVKIHKFIVTHGAAEACKNHSPDNIRGSLGVAYSDKPDSLSKRPFQVSLPNDEVFHVLDSENLSLVLDEFDTITDLLLFVEAKEEAILNTSLFIYAGEEDLIGTYYRNFSDELQKHFILPPNDDHDGLMIQEGMWDGFVTSEANIRRKEADKVSYFLDDLIQRTSENALAGVIGGDPDIFNRPSAIKELAKEPRYSRRALSEAILTAVERFPSHNNEGYRHIGLYPTHREDVGLVFLIIRPPNGEHEKLREMKQNMLFVACGAAKQKMTQYNTLIGLAIEPPSETVQAGENFLLMRGELGDEDICYINEMNSMLGFFRAPSLEETKKTVKQFPD